mgnify:CR=1 FL=1
MERTAHSEGIKKEYLVPRRSLMAVDVALSTCASWPCQREGLLEMT